MSTAEVELEVREDPAHHYPFDLTAGKVIFGFAVVLHGFAIGNPSGAAAATGNIYDGVDTSGSIDIPLSLAASETVSDWWGDRGVLFKNGLYLNITAGEIKGSFFYRHYRR